MESPWYTPELPPSFELGMNSLSILDIQSLAKLIDRVDSIDVYKREVTMSDIELYFVKNEILISFCRYTSTTRGIVLELIWNNKNYKGAFRQLFVTYILPQFKYIESGDTMSMLGFGFWKNLMTQHPEYNYYINKNGSYIKVLNPSEFDNYKEKLNSDNKYSTFIITSETL